MSTQQVKRRRTNRYLRASRACTLCRSRKVRCDLVRKKGTCTNCELDNVICVDNNPRQTSEQNVSSQNTMYPTDGVSGGVCEPISPLDSVMADESTNPAVTASSPDYSFTQPAGEGIMPASLQHPSHDLATPISETDAAFPRNLYLAETPGAIHSSRTDPVCDQNHPHPQQQSQALARNSQQAHRGPNNLASPERPRDHAVPNFIADCSSRLDMDSYAFLKAKGVWELPPLNVLASAIQGFVDYIYPLTPLIDLQKELEAIASDGASGKISLSLLYGLTLAGIPFMASSQLQSAGYSTRSAFSKTINRRLRLLYDFDCEPDRFVTIQCLLLMTYYHEETDSQKHLRHWLGIAHRLAMDICLNQMQESGSLSAHQRRVWKRLWWCCIIRDRACAIGMRNYPLISNDDCQWPNLTNDDFDIRVCSASVSAMFKDCDFLHDISIQRQLAKVCIAQAGLWQQLDGIMRLRYDPISPCYGSTLETTMLLAPRPGILDLLGLKNCEESLRAWVAQYSDCFLDQGSSASIFNTESTVLIVHSCMVNMLYHVLECALHRPSQQAFETEFHGQKPLYFRARSSASLILSMFDHLQSRNILHLLPGWSVTVLMQAALTFKDFTKENPAQACRRLQDCIEVLCGLRGRHLHAAFGISLLSSFIASRRRLTQEMQSLEGITSHNGMAAEVGKDSTPFTAIVANAPEGFDDFDELGLSDWDPPDPWFTEFLDQNI